MIRFGRYGLSVPALKFEPSVSFALANALASCSFRKVSVFLMNARWPGSNSFGSNETYQVPLDLFGRGPVFISPLPLARFLYRSARSRPRLTLVPLNRRSTRLSHSTSPGGVFIMRRMIDQGTSNSFA